VFLLSGEMVLPYVSAKTPMLSTQKVPSENPAGSPIRRRRLPASDGSFARKPHCAIPPGCSGGMATTLARSKPGAGRRRAYRRDARDIRAAGDHAADGPEVRQDGTRSDQDDGSGYRRDHLSALAQRVEVANKEARIMGSKSELLRTLVAASGGKSAAFDVRSSVEMAGHDRR
jgi:hypothetical protein